MKKNESEIDIELRRTLRVSLPKAPADNQFARKVMNRLPERRFCGISGIEKACYIIAAAILITLWIYTGFQIKQTAAITIGQIFSMSVLSVIGLGLIVNMLRTLRL